MKIKIEGYIEKGKRTFAKVKVSNEDKECFILSEVSKDITEEKFLEDVSKLATIKLLPVNIVEPVEPVINVIEKNEVIPLKEQLETKYNELTDI